MPTPRRVRANAFDTQRTDRDEAEPSLAELLPRVALAVLAPAETSEPPAVKTSPPSRMEAAPGASRPRGAGGRVNVATGRITATAARVPVELYQVTESLVKGPGKPSWGQLVAWTCQQNPDEVERFALDELAPQPGLIPRGQNKRARGSAQITARFTTDEHAAFTELVDRVRRRAADASLPPATSTTVVIAALRAAAAGGPG